MAGWRGFWKFVKMNKTTNFQHSLKDQKNIREIPLK